MRYTFVWLCLAFAACSSPLKDAPKPTPVQQSTEAVMQHLLAEIERPGRTYEINADTFFARPDALAKLVSAYESSDGAWTRWKLLRLAGKTRRADVQAFLKAEALKPIPRNGAGEVGLATTMGDEEVVSRLEAALGVVGSMPSSVNEVEEIIATVDAAVARILGSELFARGMLTDQLVAALQARGLPTSFRRLSQSEERALMSVTWNKEGQP